jgi:hypothetical protein
MGARRPWQLAMSLLTVAAAVGLSFLVVSTEARAATVVASVTASPSSNVVDGTSLSVTGTAPSSVHSVLLIECDSTQMGMVGSAYDPSHCDTNPADEVTLPVSNNAFSGSFVFHDPLTTGGAGLVSCDTGCTLLADNPTPGDVAAETTVTGNSCNGVFSGAPSGSLVKTTSAGPNNSTVSPGQTITVTLTWYPSDFGGNAPNKSDDCVEIGTTISATLSQEHKPGPTGGTDTFTYTVPSGGTNGQPICDRARVAGTLNGTSVGDKSAILCYTVMGAVTPEVPKALLLPVAGLAVGGGGLLLARRRRAGTRPQNQ